VSADLEGAGNSVLQPEPSFRHSNAAPNRFMTHLAMLEVGDDGNAATWGDHVSDEEYGAALTIDD
jgi:hypothetical protein